MGAAGERLAADRGHGDGDNSGGSRFFTTISWERVAWVGWLNKQMAVASRIRRIVTDIGRFTIRLLLAMALTWGQLFRSW